MPHKSKDSQEKFLPKPPNPSRNKPSFLYGDYGHPSLIIGDLENPLGEKSKSLEEPIGEEEPILPTQTMAENRENELFHI